MGQLKVQMGQLSTQRGQLGAQIAQLRAEMSLLGAQMSHFVSQLGQLPLCFLKVIMYWYLNLGSMCKWGNGISRSFRVISGVRQGGILSPYIFCVYVNDLILRLKKSHIGCHLIRQFVGCIFYADDLALLSPSRESMQLLLDMTIAYGNEFCISFSFKKTKTMIFGKSKNLGPTAPLTINDESIEIVNTWQYLGFHI